MIAKSLPRITAAVKSAELLASYFYRGSFYTHITFGGIALLIGWLQFSKKIRAKRLNLHRTIGKMYMVSATAVMHFSFIPSCRVISWLCWVPNLAVAQALIRQAQKTPEGALTEVSAPVQGRYKAS